MEDAEGVVTNLLKLLTFNGYIQHQMEFCINQDISLQTTTLSPWSTTRATKMETTSSEDEDTSSTYHDTFFHYLSDTQVSASQIDLQEEEIMVRNRAKIEGQTNRRLSRQDDVESKKSRDKAPWSWRNYRENMNDAWWTGRKDLEHAFAADRQIRWEEQKMYRIRMISSDEVTNIEISGRSYRFSGFHLLCLSTDLGCHRQLTTRGHQTEASEIIFEEVQMTAAVDEKDREELEWFQTFLFGSVLQFDPWNAEDSASHLRRFYLVPQYSANEERATIHQIVQFFREISQKTVQDVVHANQDWDQEARENFRRSFVGTILRIPGDKSYCVHTVRFPDVTRRTNRYPVSINRVYRREAALLIICALRGKITENAIRAAHKMNCTFNDIRLLEEALIHPSFSEYYENVFANAMAASARTAHVIHLQRTDGTDTCTAHLGISSEISHNQRLEFLGDAVFEFAVTTHLISMFPDNSEGTLSVRRSYLVQNQMAAKMMQDRGMDDFILTAGHPVFSKGGEYRYHVLADSFEAILGAVMLDSGIHTARKILADFLFVVRFHVEGPEEADLHDIWMEERNQGKRGTSHSQVPDPAPARGGPEAFEERIGYRFDDIELLRSALTHPSVSTVDSLAFNVLEFLGDAILQLLSSVHLYHQSPSFQEGVLSMIRSIHVNNKNLCNLGYQLGLEEFFRFRCPPDDPTTATWLSDCLEAIMGAIYVDGGLRPVKTFFDVVFVPDMDETVKMKKWTDHYGKLEMEMTEKSGQPPQLSHELMRDVDDKYQVGILTEGKLLCTGIGNSMRNALETAAKLGREEMRGTASREKR
ncbi:hypothetical protein PROFUN_06751 [Planoprotostelium fungivorum]|uniref:RNase III domain-containing protein n=1 Tax=Planoprotostelium fungivorum TaxID=1890364 RepID=A0A2P6NNI7_9EUKA|nr:hypothetical protein PROFUN_06751 [Planoprotostelium fungivorum]